MKFPAFEAAAPAPLEPPVMFTEDEARALYYGSSIGIQHWHGWPSEHYKAAAERARKKVEAIIPR